MTQIEADILIDKIMDLVQTKIHMQDWYRNANELRALERKYKKELSDLLVNVVTNS
jgi:hypothetical protein